MSSAFTRNIVMTAAVLCAISCGNLSAQDEPATAPGTRLSIGGRFSGDVQEYFLDGLVPLNSGERQAYFLDLRGTLLEDLEQELNAGLVARHLGFDGAAIVGANLFYDVRWTENDSTFNQVGAGVEILTTWVDARASYYYPLDDPELLSASSETDVSRTGSTRVTETRQLQVYEEPLEGFDAEIGIWLPYLSRCMPTAVFAGYYDFSSDFMDGFSGTKFRLESRIHRNIILDAEWFEDAELNRTDYFTGLRFTMAFGEKTKSRSAARPLPARMNDMVQRDFRIRTINTGPIVTDYVRDESRIRSSSVSVAPVETVPNCYLDAEGNVICD